QPARGARGAGCARCASWLREERRGTPIRLLAPGRRLCHTAARREPRRRRSRPPAAEESGLITSQARRQTVEAFRVHEKDTGSAEVQVALLTQRINDLSEYFFFQAEDGIRHWSVTGVQTCALPI